MVTRDFLLHAKLKEEVEGFGLDKGFHNHPLQGGWGEGYCAPLAMGGGDQDFFRQRRQSIWP